MPLSFIWICCWMKVKRIWKRGAHWKTEIEMEENMKLLNKNHPDLLLIIIFFSICSGNFYFRSGFVSQCSKLRIKMIIESNVCIALSNFNEALARNQKVSFNVRFVHLQHETIRISRKLLSSKCIRLIPYLWFVYGSNVTAFCF